MERLIYCGDQKSSWYWGKIDFSTEQSRITATMSVRKNATVKYDLVFQGSQVGLGCGFVFLWERHLASINRPSENRGWTPAPAP
jgi:hypothetical protein